MVRRIQFLMIWVVIGVGFLLILDIKQYTERLSAHMRRINHGKENMEAITTSARIESDLNINLILNKVRSKIKTDMLYYNLTVSGVDKLEDLIIESGGTPIRSMIVSGWRSGSTFFGDLLNAVPSNFYHYEPLLKFQIQQIRGPPHAAEATNILKNMFLCNYTGMEDYFEYGKEHLEYLNQFKHNSRLWAQCEERMDLCFDADFTSKLCKLFPIQSMKVVRYRLRLVEDILEDERLNVKVMLLVRDPRGVLQSRRYRHYCQESPDCIEPELICYDMVNDYVTAARLQEKFPDRFMAVRFEDLALNLNTITSYILNFLKIAPSRAVEEFLHMHTTVDVGGKDSTFKVTRTVPFKWKTILEFEYVNRIQEACKKAMNLWGYRLAQNASHMASKQFSPLLPYSVKQNSMLS